MLHGNCYQAGSGWDLRVARGAMGYDPTLGTPPAARVYFGGDLEAGRCWSRMHTVGTPHG